MDSKLAVFQNDQGAIELPVDVDAQTIWASQGQMAGLFDVDVRTVNDHLETVFKDAELDKNSTIRNFRIVQKEGSRNIQRKIMHYNLDAIIAVGYKVSTKQGTEFRKWATTILRQYITDGFAINPKRIEHNKNQLLKAMSDLKLLAGTNTNVGSDEAIDLTAQFAKTWFNLDAYDKSELPKSGDIKQSIGISAQDLYAALADLKKQLIDKGEATELFAQEKNPKALEGLFGNVFQSFGGQDLYPTVEEKAAHLLYFVVKNHVFNDGNKRSGAYAFVWFLKEAKLLNTTEISPQALTAITLLVAESDPEEKDKMVGLVLLLLGVEHRL